jgi:hypothetical protein
MGISRLVERLDLLMEPETYFTRRVAGLELGGEWMCKKIFFVCPLYAFKASFIICWKLKDEVAMARG